MKNRLSDLNNHLFAQMERLSDEDLKPEELEQEIARTGAIVAVSDEIVKNASLQVKAAKMVAEHGAQVISHLPEASVNRTKPTPKLINGSEAK